MLCVIKDAIPFGVMRKVRTCFFLYGCFYYKHECYTLYIFVIMISLFLIINKPIEFHWNLNLKLCQNLAKQCILRSIKILKIFPRVLRSCYKILAHCNFLQPNIFLIRIYTEKKNLSGKYISNLRK